MPRNLSNGKERSTGANLFLRLAQSGSIEEVLEDLTEIAAEKGICLCGVGFTFDRMERESKIPDAAMAGRIYVGSQGRHLGRQYNYNPLLVTGIQSVSPAGDVTFNSQRRLALAGINSTFGDIVLQENSGNSSYNSGQVALRRRARSGLTLLASYTWARSIDNGSNTAVSASRCIAKNFRPRPIMAARPRAGARRFTRNFLARWSRLLQLLRAA